MITDKRKAKELLSMSRRNIYISAVVAAAASYLFNVTAFTGSINLVHTTVFILMFAAIMMGFEKFVDWAETLEN